MPTLAWPHSTTMNRGFANKAIKLPGMPTVPLACPEILALSIELAVAEAELFA